MKKGIYSRLAFDGIRKNRQMYFPYIMTCVAMTAMYYIMSSLQHCKMMEGGFGSSTMQIILGLGTWVLTIFSVLFLFYTNAFLMRRRKTEFGLYNILGMGKRNIGVILLLETMMIYALSLVLGLFIGIAASKLAELSLDYVVKNEPDFKLFVSVRSVAMTAAIFGGIFLLLYLNSLRQIRFSSASALLKSDNVGEKPPKGNIFLGILGIAAIVCGYAISVSIEDPLVALLLFFGAVILVIIGTYLTMIAGSVLFCRLLQKNKGYYYKPAHFVSVSSMVYRMKRNGAGLASICILATMVLVMISSTTTLYTGAEDTLDLRFPTEIEIEMRYDSLGAENLADIKSIAEQTDQICADSGIEPQNVISFASANVTGQIQGTSVQINDSEVYTLDKMTLKNVVTFYFISADDYAALSGEKLDLADGEAVMISGKNDYKEDTISFNGGREFSIVDRRKKPEKLSTGMEYLVTVSYLIVDNVDAAVKGIDEIIDSTGYKSVQFTGCYCFDTGKAPDEQLALSRRLEEELYGEDHSCTALFVDDRESSRIDFYTTFGGLFYLGIVLSVVFLIAAVLIIYYKQISEGYEDERRFDIMQKVGMTKPEIRRSINSQLLTVFFLPLGLAGLHLAFAMPIVSKMLIMFGMANTQKFIITAAASFAVFALFYTVVYRLTSNAYYRIVSGIDRSR